MMNWGLSERDINLITNSIKKCLTSHQKIKIWIYGSRARGDHKKYSDIDLLIKSTPPLTEKQLTRIQDLLEESELPYKVDLVQIEELVGAYKEKIEREKKTFFSN